MNVLFDELIYKLFNENWCGPQRDDLELAKETLYKGLKQQQQGYWAGRTLYYIMVQGGFLIDGKSGTNKKLTALGEMFVEMMEKDNEQN